MIRFELWLDESDDSWTLVPSNSDSHSFLTSESELIATINCNDFDSAVIEKNKIIDSYYKDLE